MKKNFPSSLISCFLNYFHNINVPNLLKHEDHFLTYKLHDTHSYSFLSPKKAVFNPQLSGKKSNYVQIKITLNYN